MSYGYDSRPADADEATHACVGKACGNKVRRIVRYLVNGRLVACKELCAGHAPVADRIYEVAS